MILNDTRLRHDTQCHLNTQKLPQQPRHTTPRLKNNKYTPIEKKTGKKRNTTKNSHQTNTQEDKTTIISQPTPLDGQPTFKS
jgi:hypothetical protein